MLYQLSYARHCSIFLRPCLVQACYCARRCGAPGRIRTCYPRLRRPMLYPHELQALWMVMLRVAISAVVAISRVQKIDA